MQKRSRILALISTVMVAFSFGCMPKRNAGPLAQVTSKDAGCLSCDDSSKGVQGLEHRGQKLFLTGVNLGNVHLLPLRANPYGYSVDELKGIITTAFADLKSSGANSIRFWLHIDGSISPSFAAPKDGEPGLVQGLPEGLIEDLQWFVRTAYLDYGLLVNITLWSHDILAVRRWHDVSSRDRAVHIIRHPHATEAYIENALKPMLRSLNQKMPGSDLSYQDGILSWEVLNEPEGMSWHWRLYWNYQYRMIYGEYRWRRQALSYLDDRRRSEFAKDDGSDQWTPVLYKGWHFTGADHDGFNLYMYKDVTDDYPSEWDFLKKLIVDDKTLTTVEIPHQEILRFVNRIAGAVKQLVPGAKVSTGTHSMPYNTDLAMPDLDYENAPFNYYSDARLVEAGGDPLGTLDFYQVHGYPEWNDPHRDALINMFKHAKNHWQLDKPLIVGEHWSIVGSGNEMLNVKHYETLHDYGYAGAWGWAYFNMKEETDAPNGSIKRRIVAHENQEPFRNLLRGLPDRLRYPVAGLKKDVPAP